MVLNHRGFWLRGPDPGAEWGFVFGRDDTLIHRSPAAWAEISSRPSGHFLAEDGLWAWRKVDLHDVPGGHRVLGAEPGWILATHASEEVLAALRWSIWTPAVLIAAPLLLIFALFSWHAVLRWKGREESQRALEEARLAAESANRAKSAFLATMSHEIRTPMNGVLGMLELMSFSKLDPGQRRSLEIVRESGRTLLRIIDDILDFSKIEAGKLDVRPEVTSIARTVDSVFQMYSNLASSKGLLLQRRVDSRIGAAVLVDSLRLKQILNNFVSNAIKFTGQGQVEIAAELVAREEGTETVRFSVKDTGEGISAETQKKLFQPFTQADGDTTRRFGGTGLGLAICRRLARLMEGSVDLVSEVGKGTTAILTLPMPVADPKDLPTAEPMRMGAEAIGDAPRRLAPTVAEAEAEGTLVLVAEDHPINSMILTGQLGTLGYAAEVAENGAEALEKWKTGRFGLLIADCHMPILDGYGLTRAIRQFEAETRQQRRPIIACTANALRGDAEACLAAGMDDYLAKPVAIVELSFIGTGRFGWHERHAIAVLGSLVVALSNQQVPCLIEQAVGGDGCESVLFDQLDGRANQRSQRDQTQPVLSVITAYRMTGESDRSLGPRSFGLCSHPMQKRDLHKLFDPVGSSTWVKRQQRVADQRRQRFFDFPDTCKLRKWLTEQV
jgi:signal transduction histidine kinase/CheY-like chemotaxis protein